MAGVAEEGAENYEVGKSDVLFGLRFEIAGGLNAIFLHFENAFLILSDAKCAFVIGILA